MRGPLSRGFSRRVFLQQVSCDQITQPEPIGRPFRTPPCGVEEGSIPPVLQSSLASIQYLPRLDSPRRPARVPCRAKQGRSRRWSAARDALKSSTSAASNMASRSKTAAIPLPSLISLFVPAFFGPVFTTSSENTKRSSCHPQICRTLSLGR